MGCCVSTRKQKQEQKCNGSLEVEVEVEEECVKQVLSETPFLKELPHSPTKTHILHLSLEEEKTQMPQPEKFESNQVSEVSQISEICSVSTTTTTATSSKRTPNPSPSSRKRPYTVERRSKSPEKKIQATSRSGQVTTRKLNVIDNSRRRSRSPSTRRQLKPAGGKMPPAKVVQTQNHGSDKNDGVAGESLDNPHVSMECFIFL